MMAIHIAVAPSDSHQVVAAHFSDPANRVFLEDIDFENLGATDAYPVYAASVDDLTAGRLPETPVLWRHLLVSGENVVGEVDVTNDRGVRVVAVHQGPRTDGTVKALEAAQALDGDYELRVLEAPAVYFVALWLHGQRDLIVPVAPDFSGLPHHQPIALEDALPTLRERADELQRATNRGQE